MRKCIEDLKATVNNMSTRAKVAATSTAMVIVSSVPAWAVDETTTVTGNNLLTGDVMTALSQGFGDLAVTCTQVVAIATVTGISIVGLTAAAKYGMKKIKGVLSQAA